MDDWLTLTHAFVCFCVWQRLNISARVTQRVTCVLRRARPRLFPSVLLRPVVSMIGPVVIFGCDDGSQDG